MFPTQAEITREIQAVFQQREESVWEGRALHFIKASWPMLEYSYQQELPYDAAAWFADKISPRNLSKLASKCAFHIPIEPFREYFSCVPGANKDFACMHWESSELEHAFITMTVVRELYRFRARELPDASEVVDGLYKRHASDPTSFYRRDREVSLVRSLWPELLKRQEIHRPTHVASWVEDQILMMQTEIETSDIDLTEAENYQLATQTVVSVIVDIAKQRLGKYSSNG